MWKGRFSQETADLVQAYGESISYDWRLYRHDIKGSKAHAKGLHKAGILTQDELEKICTGLDEIEADITAGNFEFKIELEDIHMNIESVLTEKIGEAGAKLHTSRSRNDQVATDTRLYVIDEIDDIKNLITNLQSTLINLAEKFSEAFIPGYTHLQRGQPVLFSHHLLAYIEMLERDKSRLCDTRKRTDVMPLGSGALAGSTIEIDREFVAGELGFSKISHNSMDAISDRDFVAETLFTLALMGVHLSRLGEDLILWCSSEFNFATLSDAHTTGSSLMPQKKNPDVAELSRGKSGRLVGNLVSLLTTLKGLPMTYNRDLQEDKEPLFDSIDTAKLSLQVINEMMGELQLNEEQTNKACSDPLLLATDLADYLVKKGVPFRDAHEIVGSMTAHVTKNNTTYPELSLKEMSKFSQVIKEDVYQLFDVKTALQARKAIGAPSPEGVAKEIALWKGQL